MSRNGDVATVSSYSEGIMNSGSKELIREPARGVLRPVLLDGGSAGTLCCDVTVDFELLLLSGDALVR